jgi:hypothetical protein
LRRQRRQLHSRLLLKASSADSLPDLDEKDSDEKDSGEKQKSFRIALAVHHAF